MTQKLSTIIIAASIACIEISQELQRLPIRNYDSSNARKTEWSTKTNVQGEQQKEMDVVANEIFIDWVKNHVAILTSEEEENIIKGGLWDHVYDKKSLNNRDFDSGFEIAFDPLDGSSNLDVNVPTG